MSCDTPYFVQHSNPAMGLIPVPCGRCPPCKFRRVNSWVFRLMQELKISSSAIFVTLTYGTHSVPISNNGWLTLEPDALRLYFKRLRRISRSSGQKIRYYAAGEYGTDNHRPHYHCIIFNCNAVHAVDAWAINGVPIGGVHIGNVTKDSIAYTMKYIDKSTWKPWHNRDDRYPEFSRMSQGLGLSYLTPEIVKWHKQDPPNLYCSLHEGHTIALPRYYKNRIFNEDEVKQQLPYIQEMVKQKEDNDFKEFQRTYKGSKSYDTIMEERKLERYKRFYHRQKLKKRK